MWNDPRFAELGVNKVRFFPPYDVVKRVKKPTEKVTPADKKTLAAVDGWMNAARNSGKKVLVSFWFNDADKQHLPSVKEYSHAVRMFRARYKWVQAFTPWNEPNLPGLGPAGNPHRAGRYWRNLNWQCQTASPPCTVAAGDFADKYFTREYFNRYLDGAGHLPPIWAWHAYEDGHFHSPDLLNKFMRATTYKNHKPPPIWLTEQGGRVDEYGLGPATQDFEYMINILPNVSSRIRRFYAYQWKGDGNWDSGLIDYLTNAPRHMFSLYKAKTNP